MTAYVSLGANLGEPKRQLREALDHLGGIVGVVTTEDVLGAIFSTFCIGK